MSRLTRTFRALILALVLPALLIPSGWSARLCLCGLGSVEVAASCCEAPPTAGEGFDSCCANERAQSDPRAPFAGERSECERGECGDCCRLLESEGVELVFASPVQVAVPAATAAELDDVLPAAPRARGRIARAWSHSLAPPRASSSLPLRI